MYKVQIRYNIDDECLIPFDKNLFSDGIIYNLKTIADIEKLWITVCNALELNDNQTTYDYREVLLNTDAKNDTFTLDVNGCCYE
ncbi:MAG: hypothetical protein PHS74_00415 [Lachnospiraceae bacterium]|nr:hypothetical protein [Lachnospiraceae bacterium]